LVLSWRLAPSNIGLTSDSEAKIIDFGLAKAITDAGGKWI